MKFLIVVDMQNDFVDGALGTEEAQAIVQNAVRTIETFDGEIFVTYDTHAENYLDTAEGRKLPVKHCIEGTDGWQLNGDIQRALNKKGYTPVKKYTFGSMTLPEFIREKAKGEAFSVELLGLCTDICVVSNALILKAAFPEADIAVHASCCAGVTPKTHEAALSTMQCCQIDIVD